MGKFIRSVIINESKFCRNLINVFHESHVTPPPPPSPYIRRIVFSGLFARKNPLKYRVNEKHPAFLGPSRFFHSGGGHPSMLVSSVSYSVSVTSERIVLGCLTFGFHHPTTTFQRSNPPPPTIILKRVPKFSSKSYPGFFALRFRFITARCRISASYIPDIYFV